MRNLSRKHGCFDSEQAMTLPPSPFDQAMAESVLIEAPSFQGAGRPYVCGTGCACAHPLAISASTASAP